MENYQHKSCKAGALTGLALALFLPLAWVHAQDEEEDDIFELSPFSVSGDEAVGYQANTTLAGSRLSTDLKDVATSIQVVTEKFLEDTAATGAESLLVYTTNTEVAGLGGNFSNPVDTGTSFEFDQVKKNPNDQTRVRGLAEADLSREFFLSDIPFDSYNTERVTINRGANNILFGLGSPGGIINNQLKRAFLGDSRMVRFRVDNRGSFRAEFDFNQQLMENMAARVIGVSDDKKWKQRFTDEKDERIFVDFFYNPIKNDTFDTSLRMHFEEGNIRANRPDVSTPISNIPEWLERGAPGGEDFWDPRVDDFRDRDANNPDIEGPGPDVHFMGVNVRQSHIFPDPNSSEPAPIGFQGMNVPNMRDDGRFPALTTPFIRGRNSNRPFESEAVLTDDKIFDFRNEKLTGPSDAQNEDFTSFNVTLDQTFWDNKAGFSLTFDYQKHERFILDEGDVQRVSHAILIDTNPYHIDGRKNENFRRPFTVLGRAFRDKFQSNRQAYQATLFYEEKFSERDGWVSWLGNHRITGLLKTQNIKDRFRRYIDVGIDDRAADFLVRDFSSRITKNRRNVNRTHFLGPAIPENADISQAQAQGLTVPSRPQDEIRTIIWNPATQQFEDQTFQLRPMLPDEGELNRVDVDSYAAIIQSKFLNDNVVFTGGWRRDEADSFINAVPERTEDFRARLDEMTLPDEPDDSVEDDTFSWGVVAHMPEMIKERLPFGIGGSFHYSESENFQPQPGRITVFGDEVPAPSGETEEMGFTATFMEGKGSIRVNWFETDMQNVGGRGTRGAQGIPGFNLGEASFLDTLEETIDIGLNPPSVRDTWELPPKEFREAANWVITRDEQGRIIRVDETIPSNMVATTDFSTEGVEIEGVFNPVSNWTLLFNIARQESVRTNIAPEFQKLINLRLPVWKAHEEIWIDDRGTRMVLAQRERRTLIPMNKLLAQEGGVAQELREWRANLVSNYTFTEGFMEGFGFGGAGRWQDNAAIGFGTKIGESFFGDGGKTEVLDVDNPKFGPTEFHLDLWISYERKLFDRLDWKIQLNAVNALNDDDLIPVGQDPDGTFVGMRIQDPIRFMVTNTFRF